MYKREPAHVWAIPLLTLTQDMEALYIKLTGQPPAMTSRQLVNSFGSLLEMTAVAVFDACTSDEAYRGLRVAQGLPARDWEGLNSHPALCGDFEKVRVASAERGGDSEEDEEGEQGLQDHATALKMAPGLPCRLLSLTCREKVPFGQLELVVSARMASCALPDRVHAKLQGPGTPKARCAWLLARPASSPVYVRGASPTLATRIRAWDLQLSCGGKSTSIISGYVGRIPPAGMAVLLELLASVLDIKAQVPRVKTDCYTLDCLYSALVSPHGSHVSAYQKQGRAGFIFAIALPSKQADQDWKKGSLSLTPPLPKAKTSGSKRIRLR